MEVTMEEYELNSLQSETGSINTHSVEIESNDFIAFKPICRYCKEDASKGELIRPCECTGDKEFMHIRCLEKLTNLRKQSHCTYCNAAFPVEVKYKSLTKICRNRREMCDMFKAVCRSFFMTIVMITYDLLMFFLMGYLFLLTFEKNKTSSQIIFIYIIILILFTLYILNLFYKMKVPPYIFKILRCAGLRWHECNTERKVRKNVSHNI